MRVEARASCGILISFWKIQKLEFLRCKVLLNNINHIFLVGVIVVYSRRNDVIELPVFCCYAIVYIGAEMVRSCKNEMDICELLLVSP